MQKRKSKSSTHEKNSNHIYWLEDGGGPCGKHEREMSMEVDSSPESPLRNAVQPTPWFWPWTPWAENLAEPHSAWTTDLWKLWDNKSGLFSFAKFVVMCYNSDRRLIHHRSFFMLVSFPSFGSQLKCQHIQSTTILLNMNLFSACPFFSLSVPIACFLHGPYHSFPYYTPLMF